MPTLTRARALWALPAVVLVGPALVVLALAVVTEVRMTPSLGTALVPDPSWIFGLTAVVHAVVTAAVLRRTGVNRMSVLLLALSVYWILATVTHVVVRSAEVGAGLADGASGAEVVLLWSVKLTSISLAAGANVLVYVFPNGRLLPGRWGGVGVVGLTGLVLGTAGLLVQLAPLTLTVDPALVPSLARFDALAVTVVPGTGWVPSVATIVSLSYVYAALCALTVVVRYRRSTGIERDQIRWVLWGVVTVAFIILGFRLVLDPGQLSTLGILLAVNILLVSVGVALINPSLVSIEELLSRTLVYGTLCVAIILVDLAALAGLTTVLGERLGDEQVVLLVLLVSAAVYNPLRAWLWTFARRLVLGEREDRYDVVAGLASSLEAADQSREQLVAVAQAVAQAFGISYVAVEVHRGGDTSVATWGSRPPEVRRLPITYRGDEVGQLVLPARGVRTRLSARDQRLLGDLVRQAATAARTGRLAEELQENRQLLVAAREEERRRIRHDLHEDLGPTLGGLVHQVETARLLVRERPEAAKETIARTSLLLREVVADVRRVVHDLRPPALDDRGLVGALRQQAELATTETLLVTVEGERLDALPAAVEVAAFRLVNQALADVRATVGATRAAVCLTREPRGLVVSLDTDADLDPESLRAGAAEIGGRVDVEPPLLVVRLPIREDAA